MSYVNITKTYIPAKTRSSPFKPKPGSYHRSRKASLLVWHEVLRSKKDKIGSKLAAKLTPKPRSLAFLKIRMPSGTLTQNPQRIMVLWNASTNSMPPYIKAITPAPPPPWRIPRYPISPQTLGQSHSSPRTAYYLIGGHRDHQDTQGSAPGPDGFFSGILQKHFQYPDTLPGPVL